MPDCVDIVHLNAELADHASDHDPHPVADHITCETSMIPLLPR
jgi:hypothetical protein